MEELCDPHLIVLGEKIASLSRNQWVAHQTLHTPDLKYYFNAISRLSYSTTNLKKEDKFCVPKRLIFCT